jgi:DNA-binding GntR family transcriptional regulator
MEHLNVRTLSDQVFDVLRERILSGALKPDAPIRQEAIALELNISKIPVREALAKLEQEGLLASHPHRGFVVRALSADEAEDVFSLRLKIEPDLAAMAAGRAVAADHARACQALADLDAELKSGGAGSGRLNRSFHMALVQPSMRPMSLQVLERLHGLSERYVRVHLGPQGRDERARKEHAALLEAWIDGNQGLVIKTTSAHISATLADLREQLTAQKAQ